MDTYLDRIDEKEAAEEVEEEDDGHSDIDHSFVEDEQDDKDSIEVPHRNNNGDNSNHAEENLLNGDIAAKSIRRGGSRSTLSTPMGNGLIAPAILDRPLTMVT